MTARRKGPSGTGGSKRTPKRAVRKGAAKKRATAKPAAKKAGRKKASSAKSAKSPKKTARKATPRKKTRAGKKTAKAPAAKRAGRKKTAPKKAGAKRTRPTKRTGTQRTKPAEAKARTSGAARKRVQKQPPSGTPAPARGARQAGERVPRFRIAATRAREIGRIAHHYAAAGAATMSLTGVLRVGDWVAVRGHTTDVVERVVSLRIDDRDVPDAAAGDTVGIAFTARVRRGDRVDRLDP